MRTQSNYMGKAKLQKKSFNNYYDRIFYLPVSATQRWQTMFLLPDSKNDGTDRLAQAIQPQAMAGA